MNFAGTAKHEGATYHYVRIYNNLFCVKFNTNTDLMFPSEFVLDDVFYKQNIPEILYARAYETFFLFLADCHVLNNDDSMPRA